MPAIKQKKKSTQRPPYRRPWEELMRRVGHEVLTCPRCDGTMKLLQVVEDPVVIERILIHLGLPTTLPPVAPARAPPETDLDLCLAQTYPDSGSPWA